MAEVTVFDRPGNLTVMAHATVFSIDNLTHGDVVGAGSHLEAKLVMTDLAAKAYAVEPVGKDNRPHTFCL